MRHLKTLDLFATTYLYELRYYLYGRTGLVGNENDSFCLPAYEYLGSDLLTFTFY